ncbi:MAG: hypothetical protein OXC46_10175 [Thaumarchaeota archaeon]|nr:hypothetical protein [Nitrososphaerota archaeon]
MTHCSGCGMALSWKKYRFQRQWRIPGYYCKNCMLELGRDFDKYGTIKLPTRRCDLCDVEYYFLKPFNRGSGHKNYCHVCHEAATNGVVAPREKGTPPPQPKKLPLVMMIFAGLGGFMMIAGLLFTMMSTGSDANIMSILFGAVTTALGFVLIRRTLKSRSMLLGTNPSKPEMTK